MENNHEEVRRRAVELGDDEPLCFTIATIYEDPDYLSEMSEPICMFRCSWEDDCNYYMEFDDEDFKEMEYEVCAGIDVEIESGCFDMGFCDSTSEGRDWTFYLWPYNTEDEDEVRWFEEEGMYYWIPTVYTNPPGCQLEYEIKSAENIEWQWDPWCTDEYYEGACQSIQFWPRLLDEGSRAENYFKIRVWVSGTDTRKDFYQFFTWDWEYYNEMQNWDYDGDEEFECPPDMPDCMDDWYDDWYDFYYDDEMDCMCAPEETECMCDDWDMEDYMPTYDELLAFFEGLNMSLNFDDNVYNYFIEEFAPEDDPTTIDALMNWLGAPSGETDYIME
jgi:hypothetical protein